MIFEWTKLTLHKFIPVIWVPALILIGGGAAEAYPGLTFETGGGYSSNLYADSFSLGDSYLISGFSFSDTEFKMTKLSLFYDLTYCQYDTRNSINQFNHFGGITLFRKQRGEKLRWGLEIAGTYRNYAEINADYNNYKIFARGDASYNIKPGLQLKLLYQYSKSAYSGFENLDHNQQLLESEIIKTFPSRTTARVRAQYLYRKFDYDASKADWLDLELKLSQSIDIKTGVSGSGMIRFAGNGTRPISSYYFISGITSYWDPWDGFQLNCELKRIMPWGIISVLDLSYWSRKYNYSDIQQSELPWLSDSDSRLDHGWQIGLDINRQINLYNLFGRAVRLSLTPGYVSNSSDDYYYRYDYFYIQTSVKLDIF